MYRCYGVLIFAVLILFNGCSEEKTPVATGSIPDIMSVNALNKWNPRLQQKYKIEVKVSDPQGPDNIKSVIVEVQRESGESVIFSDSLYDDGAFYNSEDGDVIARDGVFSNRYFPDDISNPLVPGLYLFRFMAIDYQNNQSPDVEYVISFGENRPPQITGVLAPDSLSVNLVPGTIHVTVSDSDGVEDIERVYFESQKNSTGQVRFEGELFNDGDPSHGDMIAGDDVFSTILDTAFLVGKKDGYELLFHAVDSFQEKNDVVPRHAISVYNNSPEITGISAPENMVIPANETEFNHEPLKATVNDPETLADIESVYFYSFRNDTALFNGKPVLLKDNGKPFDYNSYVNELSAIGEVSSVGDAAAGDGEYTFPLVIESYFKPGSYLFKFYTRDKAGNLTGPVDHILNVSK